METLADGVNGIVVGSDDDDADAGTGSAGDNDDEGELTTDAVSAQNELIKRRVQLAAQARLKAGKRKTRNNAKLSVKGRLYHKDQF